MHNTRNVVYRYFFSGSYEVKIDRKNRIQIPQLWRHVLKDKAIITKGHDGCLALWTTDFFQYFAQQKIETSSSDAEKQITKRLFIGKARTLDIDSKNRIIIPEEIILLFEADRIMYLIGVGDYIEIWTKALFESWKSDQTAENIENENA